jgi:hypothetical protein
MRPFGTTRELVGLREWLLSKFGTHVPIYAIQKEELEIEWPTRST